MEPISPIPLPSGFNFTLAKEYAKRAAGFALSMFSAWLGSKLAPPGMQTEVAGAIATVGAAITTKAIPYFVPTKENVAAQNQAPKPASYTAKGLQR